LAGQTPAKPEPPPAIRSGVSAERRHLKKSGKVCGGLPTRRYGKGESSAIPLKNSRAGIGRPFVIPPIT